MTEGDSHSQNTGTQRFSVVSSRSPVSTHEKPDTKRPSEATKSVSAMMRIPLGATT